MLSFANKVRALVLLQTEGDLAGDGAYLTSDLGFDSLDISMIGLRLEEEFGIQISDDEIRTAQTIGGLIDLVEQKVG